MKRTGVWAAAAACAAALAFSGYRNGSHEDCFRGV